MESKVGGELLDKDQQINWSWVQVASPSSGAILGVHAGHSSPVHGHMVSQSQIRMVWLCKTINVLVCLLATS